MSLRVNIGCGQRPTQGWRNFDNSLSVRFARVPVIPELLHKVKLLKDTHYQFIRVAREKRIESGNATKGLPVQDNSVDVLYSSHMFEHFDRVDADRFLKEAFRIIRPGGMIRMAVPDIRKHVEQYNESGDADSFITATRLCVPRPRTLVQRLRLAIVGTRTHQWMYDGKSLARLLVRHGFVKAEIMPAGETEIVDHEPLELRERVSESVYVEAEKPGP